MIGRSVAGKLGLAAVAAYGFSKGLDESGAVDSLFDLTTGNPNIDEDVLGTNLTARDMFLPSIPGIPSRLNRMQYGTPGMRSGLPGVMSRMSTGIVNSKTLSAGYTQANEPFDEREDNTSFSNRMPQADGSLVFGMYNSRHGG